MEPPIQSRADVSKGQPGRSSPLTYAALNPDKFPANAHPVPLKTVIVTQAQEMEQDAAERILHQKIR